MTAEPRSQGESVAEKVGNALPDMAFMLTSDGRYSGFLPGGDVEPLLPPEQFLGKQIEDVVGKDIGSDARSLIQRVLTTGSVETIEYELDSNKGLRRFEARLAPIDANEVVALVRDITKEPTGSGDRAMLLTLLVEARKAIELAAPHLPRDSEADLAAVSALAGIYRFEGLLPPTEPSEA